MTAAAELLSGSPGSGAGGAARDPFETPASRKPSAVAAPSAERRATATAKDIFATSAIRDRSRTHLAFSTSRSRSTPDGHSPRLGSAFATVRPAPPSASEVVPSEESSAASDAFELGHTRFEQRDYAGALEAWRAAAELMPSNRTYQANLRRLERLLEPG